MRKFYFLLCLLIVSSTSWGQLLLNEDFTGLTTGANLAGQNSWTKGGTGPNLTVENTSPITYSGYNGGGGEYAQMPTASSTSSRVYKGFTPTIGAGNTFYYSFLLNLSTVTTTGDYFISLGDSAIGTNYFGKVFAKANGTGYNIGISKVNNVSTATFGTTVFNLGETYLVVVKYVVVSGSSNDEAYIWINPSLNNEPTNSSVEASISTGGDPSLLGGKVGNFHWHNRSVSNPVGKLDGIRVAVGSTSADAWTALGAAAPVASGSLSTTALTAFGSVCLNDSSVARSFTITGTNLSTADVVVGPLTGYSFSETANGTFTTTLTLPSAGGAFSKDVFVKLTPTAVTFYDGNIPVSGGGATVIDVAATGAGVNTPPTVTTGTASAVTATTAVLAGTIGNTGCSAVTAYGIEYSLLSNFSVTDTINATNLTGSDFSATLTGLLPSTTYYYAAWAENSGGRTYGTVSSFTTSSAPTLTATTLADFGNRCLNTSSNEQSFTLTGTNLTSNDVVVGPLDGYSFSLTSGGTFTASVAVPQVGGVINQTVYVKFTPTAAQSYNGNIPVTGGGATAINVAVTGSGINTTPTVTTVGSSNINNTSATLAGTIPANGCTAITAYGFEYSTTSGFANGTGTTVSSSNIDFNFDFTAQATGLTQGTTYYYHAFATNNGGTSYGSEMSFTTTSPNPFLVVGTLSPFGNVCINTTRVDSFMITGSNLTTANITVGPLAGYKFATSLNGTYSAVLSIAQTGGSFSQMVYVQFEPTAVQAYAGNINVNGGGASSNYTVAASGAGINDAPTVVTGTASSIGSTNATVSGTIPNAGCSAVTAYGVEYSTTSGFANGSGTQVAAINLSNTNFSAVLTGLTPGTTYYYKVYATNGGGTTYGTEQSFTTLVPAITVSNLAGFGDVCINKTAGPNSFTITGADLTGANVTVSALAGYTFSTTSGGTYQSSLSLTQPGGAYSQTIFVKFNPTAAQAYNGNIIVSGGGATASSVAVTGTGINTPAIVVSGAASAITSSSATIAGTFSDDGCTAPTAYGVEYSTTNNFANGTGTKAASTNRSGTGYTVALSGLTSSTTYYYKAYATNSGGTSYGAQLSFTTTTPPPATITVSALASFGSVCLNTTPAVASFTITGANLTAAPVTVGALAGYTYSTTANGTYTSTLSLPTTGGTFNQTVFVKFTPTAAQAYNGNIPVSGGGAAAANVSVTGTGVNTPPTVATGASTNITTSSATLAGSITDAGCATVTGYGIEYSGINGFAGGSGTKVAGANITTNAFTVPVSGLVQGTTYYYRAYATNAGGTAYGPQQTLVIPAIANGTNVYPVPLKPGQLLTFTQSKLAPGYYGLQLLNSMGQEVYRKDLNIQVDFINEKLALPASLPSGIYKIRLVSNTETIVTKTVMLF